MTIGKMEPGPILKRTAIIASAAPIAIIEASAAPLRRANPTSAPTTAKVRLTAPTPAPEFKNHPLFFTSGIGAVLQNNNA